MSPSATHLRLVDPDLTILPVRPEVPSSDRPREPVIPATAEAADPVGRRPLGHLLVEEGYVTPDILVQAVARLRMVGTSLADVLLANGWITEDQLLTALSAEWNAGHLDPSAFPPDPAVAARFTPDEALLIGALPWRKLGGMTIIAATRPAAFQRAKARLPEGEGPYLPAFVSRATLQDAMTGVFGPALNAMAEARPASSESCRSFDPRRALRIAALAACTGLLLALTMPAVLGAGLMLWATLTLLATMGLKLAALVAMATMRIPDTAQATGPQRLPMITMMVPLFHEADIAARLVARLSRLTWPRELTDILLVVEQSDQKTRSVLAASALPSWMRIVTVPEGTVRTKPRALNYALNFAKGDIVGVWDAEDAPAPDQLTVVARRFAAAPPDVACLQGILDFYSARQNWLSRCFAIEYAAWFRVVLPGLARMGLAVPLGGTTLFFRRAALDAIGAWDAHNVTEDADLGIRLARRGFRTELIATVTEEEPNARALPWIRQRSRWLKGYAMTWSVHMRDPAALWSDLGAWRFFGVQVLFLGTLTQFALAPLLWAFWAFALLPGANPVPLLSRPVLVGCSALFVLSELVGMIVGIYAAHRAGHRHLMPWVPTLILYFPLGTAAVIKALAEVVTRPFYWDKTTHGVIDAPCEEAAAPSIAQMTETTPDTAGPVPVDDSIADALAANRIIPARPATPVATPRRPRPPLVLIEPLGPGNGLRVARTGGAAQRDRSALRARDTRAAADRRTPMPAATD